MKRLSFLFFMMAVLLAGVAIAAVVVRASGLSTPVAIAAPEHGPLTSN